MELNLFQLSKQKWFYTKDRSEFTYGQVRLYIRSGQILHTVRSDYTYSQVRLYIQSGQILHTHTVRSDFT